MFGVNIDDPMFEENKHRKRPQDDVPVERIIHYIVKDYRRMFEKCDRNEQKIQSQSKKIKELVHKLNKREVKAMLPSEQKTLLQSLISKAERSDKVIQEITEERDTLAEENKKLHEEVNMLHSTRNAVVEAVTDDLQSKLKEANNRIKLLAQAVSEPEKADSVFLQRCVVHTIETDDDRKWMTSAMKQLEKASQGFDVIQQKLQNVEHGLEVATSFETKDKTLKSLNKAIAKITSVVSHIECFMDKVGEIKVEE